jgi:signal transduction histidine kinase
MHSFLGVPIVARQTIIGAFYLTEKENERCFTDADRELIELLAAHAAIAITNARLYERSRELSILSERNRLALELHDAVTQKLFSLNLAAESAATLLDRGAAETRAQLEKVRALSREALDELRSLILGLRPADLESDGLEGALRKEMAMVSSVHGIEVTLHVGGHALSEPDPPRDAELLRIANEAVHNAVRHAGADHVTVELSGTGDSPLTLSVTDDGAGFDPADPELRSRHLGLTSMEERAGELGGTLEIASSAGRGTTVRLRVPRSANGRR